MDKTANKSPEAPNDDLMNALKLISDTIVGPELRALKDLVKSTDKARQASQTNLDERLEKSLTEIREETAEIAASLRQTKSDMEADRKKWQEEIKTATDLMDKLSTELSDKIRSTETALQADAKKRKEQIESKISDLRQEHIRRFSAVEDRVMRCESENNAHKEESNLLARRLSMAAQSLVTGSVGNIAVDAAALEQVDSLLTELDDGASNAQNSNPNHADGHKGPNQNKRDDSEKIDMTDVGAGYEKSKK